MADSNGREMAGRYAHVGALLPPPGFEALISVNAGLDGPVALWGRPEDEADFRSRHRSLGGMTCPQSRTSTSPPAALVAYGRRPLRPQRVVTVESIPVAHPLVQRLPGGEFLVVGARCAWTSSGPEHNALVIGADGEIARTGTLGDGIKQMLVDAAGDIWVGYFDEGVLGSFGWGRTSEPLGSAGIVRWSSRFEKVQEVTGVDVLDCYVLNVGRGRAWACTYTDFPVVEFGPDGVVVHPTAGLHGPQGLIVAGDAVAVIGSYDNRGAFLLGSVRAGLDRWGRGHLAMPDVDSAPEADALRSVLACRGAVADLFVGPDWYTFDLRGVPAFRAMAR